MLVELKSFSWAWLLGGLALFFYGMSTARCALQLLAGDQLRLWITRLTGNRFKALGLGGLITVVLQSSTATMVMLISFVSTGLISLSQAFGVVLGADIGTTFVVILLSIKQITEYALIMIALGFLWQRLIKGRAKFVGDFLFSFGLVFFGMQLMTAATSPLSSDPIALEVFSFLTNHPVETFFLATFFTAMGQTSAATIGLTLALAHGGALNLEGALPMVLGANVGTTSTAIMAGISSGVNGKRVALAHFLTKLIGAVMVLPFIGDIAGLLKIADDNIVGAIPFIVPGVAGLIAMFHLAFNGMLALIFLPFLDMGVWIISKIIPSSVAEKQFGNKYLDKRALETPALAFAQTKREILRIGGLVSSLLKKSLGIFRPADTFSNTQEAIESQDDKIDLLDREVRFYLTRISQSAINERQASQQMALFSITDEMEAVGDTVSRDLIRLGRKKYEKQRTFSEDGWKDLKLMHKEVLELCDLTLTSLTSPEEELIHKAQRKEKSIEEIEIKLRHAHFNRLNKGQPEAFETSSIHLDALGAFARISRHLGRIVEQAKLVG